MPGRAVEPGTWPAAGLPACRAPAPAPPVDPVGGGGAPDGFRLSSAAFADGGSIPARYTCEGLDLSPPLAWSAPPAGTLSLALLVSDPDAPDPAAPRLTWTHWVLLNLPPEAGRLDEQAGNGPAVAPALDGLNDWERGGWGGPCPPVGRHRYQFQLLALDTRLAARADWTRHQVEEAARGHELGRARLTGTYQKSQP